MAWLTPRDEPITFSREIKNSYWKGHKFASEGAYWGLPILAMEVASAKRGELIPTLAAQSVSLAVQPVLGGIAAAGLTATFGLPPVAAALAGTLLVGYATNQFTHTLIRGFSELTAEGRFAQKLRFGGDYIDTKTSQQRRQRAAIELTGTSTTSRRWLGQEALFLHR
jgi:hypothetical protein